MVEGMGSKNGAEVTFNGITCLQHFTKIHQSVPKLMVGGIHQYLPPFFL
jgi:hypothetical protein